MNPAASPLPFPRHTRHPSLHWTRYFQQDRARCEVSPVTGERFFVGPVVQRADARHERRTERLGLNGVC